MSRGNLTKAQTETAHNEKSLGRQVGEYKINRIRIISPLRSKAFGVGSYIDVSEGTKAVWSEINFYEDIDTPIVSGDITLSDAVGIVEATPILGEEILEVLPTFDFGRIAAQTAKQVITKNVHEAERERQVYHWRRSE